MNPHVYHRESQCSSPQIAVHLGHPSDVHLLVALLQLLRPTDLEPDLRTLLCGYSTAHQLVEPWEISAGYGAFTMGKYRKIHQDVDSVPSGKLTVTVAMDNHHF